MCQNVSLGLWTECVSLQITEQILTLQEDKLQPYKMEIAKDAAGAVTLVSEFEASIHTPAMVLTHSEHLSITNSLSPVLVSYY